MWAAGVYDLGLTEAHFWELTPRQFHTLWQRHTDSERRQDRRFAMLAYLYANAHRDEKKRPQPFTIEDFLPGATPAEPRQQSVEDMVATAKMITETWGAITHRPNGHS